MQSLQEGWRDLDLTSKDGHVIASSWSNIRLADDTQVGIGIDIRERKRAEAERERLYQEAERRRAEAERANRAKDEFLAMLGHELRNPLGAIVSAIGVMDQVCRPGDRSAPAREIIARQARHLSRLVEDLLDVARLETGKIVVQRRPVDLRSVADRALAALQHGRRPAGLTLSVAGESVDVDGDSIRLEQVVSNLLGQRHQVHAGRRRGRRQRGPRG
jgi:signal transduction histidine kinase